MPVLLLLAPGRWRCCCWLQYASVVIVIIVTLSLSSASALLSRCHCHYHHVVLLSLSLPWSSAASQCLACLVNHLRDRKNGTVHSLTRPLAYICLCTSQISFEG